MHVPVCFQTEHLPLDRLLPWWNPQVHPNRHWQDLQRTSSPVVCPPQSSFRWFSEIFDSAFFSENNWCSPSQVSILVTAALRGFSALQIILTHEHADAVLGLDEVWVVQPRNGRNDIEQIPIFLTQFTMDRFTFTSCCLSALHWMTFE